MLNSHNVNIIKQYEEYISNVSYFIMTISQCTDERDEISIDQNQSKILIYIQDTLLLHTAYTYDTLH